MSAELLTCPFCGGSGRYVKHQAGIRGTMGFDSWDAVACASCGGTVGASDRRFRDKEDARKAWNTRAAIAVQEVPTEAMKHAGANALANLDRHFYDDLSIAEAVYLAMHSIRDQVHPANASPEGVQVPPSEVDFGDYVYIEQHRYGGTNEMFAHKVICRLESNAWIDVPAIVHKGSVLHKTTEPVVNVICCGVSEDEVLRYRVADIHSAHRYPRTTTKAAS